MPTDRNKNSNPKPKKIAANKLMSSSLKTSALLLTPFGRETTKTKNHDVKNVPIINSNVAKCGNTDGLMGDTYRVNDSIFPCFFLKLTKYKMRILLLFRLDLNVFQIRNKWTKFLLTI